MNRARKSSSFDCEREDFCYYALLSCILNKSNCDKSSALPVWEAAELLYFLVQGKELMSKYTTIKLYIYFICKDYILFLAIRRKRCYNKIYF